ncbi:hypothetical protein Tco_0632421 [Tanacetum coccineum]
MTSVILQLVACTYNYLSYKYSYISDVSLIKLPCDYYLSNFGNEVSEVSASQYISLDCSALIRYSLTSSEIDGVDSQTYIDIFNTHVSSGLRQYMVFNSRDGSEMEYLTHGGVAEHVARLREIGWSVCASCVSVKSLYRASNIYTTWDEGCERCVDVCRAFRQYWSGAVSECGVTVSSEGTGETIDVTVRVGGGTGETRGVVMKGGVVMLRIVAYSGID